MRVTSNEDGDLLSQFDKIKENDIPLLERFINMPPQILDTPHRKMFINNHTDAIKSRKKEFYI